MIGIIGAIAITIAIAIMTATSAMTATIAIIATMTTTFASGWMTNRADLSARIELKQVGGIKDVKPSPYRTAIRAALEAGAWAPAGIGLGRRVAGRRHGLRS